MSDQQPSGDPSRSEQERDLIEAARAQAADMAEFEGADLPPPDTFPGYDIVREIHRGGQGAVYLAIQKATKRKVAIKVMHAGPFAGSTGRARFEREVQILGQLNHPNIVRIHDSGTTAAGAFFYVMDYISGRTLDEHLKTTSKSTVHESLRLFAKICEAVNAAHLRGVIHRDLKPANVRVDSNGEPIVVDFGLAKIAVPDLTAEEHPKLMSMTGQFIGSLPWASPEQAEGTPGSIDVRTDVYSLGVILYQMLTGKFPYEVVGNIRDVMDNILRAEPARPSTIRRQINDEVETIVLKCLSKERDRRYQSAGELARDIHRYLSGEPIEAKRASGWYVIRTTLRRYKPAVAVGAAFLVLIVAFGITMSVLYTWAKESEHDAKVQKGVAEAEAIRARDAERAANEQRTLAQTEADKSRSIQSFLQDMLTSIRPAISEGKDVLVRDVLDLAGARIDTQLSDKPEVAAAIHDTIGMTYFNIARREEAERHLKAALQLRESALGPDDDDTVSTRNNLALVYRNARRLDEAEALLRRNLDSYSRRGPEVATDRAVTQVNLARVLVLKAGGRDEAADLYRQAIAALGASGGSNANLWVTMAHYAEVLQTQGKLAEAEETLRKVLALQVEAKERLRAAKTRIKLADVLQDQNKGDDADRVYDDALPELVAILKPLDQDLLSARGAHARFRLWQGRPADSETEYRALLGDLKGAEPQAVKLLEPIFRAGLGSALVALGRYEDAEAELTAAFAVLGAESQPAAERAKAVKRMIELYEKWGKADDAAKYRDMLPK